MNNDYESLLTKYKNEYNTLTQQKAVAESKINALVEELHLPDAKHETVATYKAEVEEKLAKANEELASLIAAYESLG